MVEEEMETVLVRKRRRELERQEFKAWQRMMKKKRCQQEEVGAEEREQHGTEGERVRGGDLKKKKVETAPLRKQVLEKHANANVEHDNEVPDNHAKHDKAQQQQQWKRQGKRERERERRRRRSQGKGQGQGKGKGKGKGWGGEPATAGP